MRFDITDEKEFNYIIQGLFEHGDVMKQKVTDETGYSNTYYGLTKKYKVENPQEIISTTKISEPLNSPEIQLSINAPRAL